MTGPAAGAKKIFENAEPAQADTPALSLHASVWLRPGATGLLFLGFVLYGFVGVKNALSAVFGGMIGLLGYELLSTTIVVVVKAFCAGDTGKVSQVAAVQRLGWRMAFQIVGLAVLLWAGFAFVSVDPVWLLVGFTLVQFIVSISVVRADRRKHLLNR